MVARPEPAHPKTAASQVPGAEASEVKTSGSGLKLTVVPVSPGGTLPTSLSGCVRAPRSKRSLP